ncbi:Dom-3 Z [Boothiomyces macroporosus]|uniref:Decapping nuclease n=1 Tax=Boothiomyces macroporosus TaxID=261099 RepID=A0AAD5US18_9FUNG|nr:Dom-3 Z [Boothiomyces macroporosus]
MTRLLSDLSTASFRLPSIVSLGKERSAYSRPKEICHFSFDENRNLLLASNAALSKYYPQELPYNLHQGYPDDYTQRNDEEEYLDALLNAIQNEKLEKKPSFVTWRGIMTLIVCTPYQQRDDWELKASLVEGTIYLMQVKQPQAEQDPVNTYYGYKFEASFTGPIDGPSSEPPVVNTNIQYCSVFQAKLSRHNLILGGEVDCIHNDQYCELKTHKVIENDRMESSLRKYKMLKTYIQSHLAGVAYMIFGFKKDQEIVAVKEYKTSQIPVMCADHWNRHVCFNFGSKMTEIQSLECATIPGKEQLK